MKNLLSISLLTNLCLLGTVIFLLAGRQREEVAVRKTAAAEEPAPAAASSASILADLPAAKSELFRWSQIEASDYAIYVSNLRTIGCPEQTIRDIIAADLDAGIYAPLRKQAEQKQAGASTAAGFSHSALQSELERLHNEEAVVIAALLGSSGSSNNVAADAPAHSRSLRDRAKDAPGTMPVVLRDVDLAALKLSAQQSNVVAGLRQRFVSEIGGAGQDPADPAYRERWNKAQVDADDRLKAMLGLRAYQDLEFRARSAGNH